MYTYISVALGIACVFVVPAVYYTYLQKKRTKIEISKFNQLAKKRDLNLDYAESMPNLLIGLDATSKKLFASESLNGENVQIADLQALVSCEIHTVRKPNSGEITSIAVHLSTNNKTDQRIVFYNAGLEVNPDAVNRLEVAEKWKKIISAHILS